MTELCLNAGQHDPVNLSRKITEYESSNAPAADEKLAGLRLIEKQSTLNLLDAPIPIATLDLSQCQQNIFYTHTQ